MAIDLKTRRLALNKDPWAYTNRTQSAWQALPRRSVGAITTRRWSVHPGFIPFTRASSAGLAGKRTAACLRLEEPSSAGPCQAEQRSEPAGPRSRVPGGIAKGGRASGPLWLAVKAKWGLGGSTMLNKSNICLRAAYPLAYRIRKQHDSFCPWHSAKNHKKALPGFPSRAFLHLNALQHHHRNPAEND